MDDEGNQVDRRNNKRNSRRSEDDDDERPRVLPASNTYKILFWILIGVLGAPLLACGVGIVGISLLGYTSNAKEKAAQVGIQTLEGAVDAYYLDYNRYPNELADLTVTLPDGRAAKLPQTALIDPWGQQFQYESKNLHPKTQKPKIFSLGEPGSKKPISNW